MPLHLLRIRSRLLDCAYCDCAFRPPRHCLHCCRRALLGLHAPNAQQPLITIPLSAIAGIFALIHDTALNQQVAVNPSPNGGGSAHALIAIFVFIAILAYLELETLDNC